MYTLLTRVPYTRVQGNEGKEVQHMSLKSVYKFLFIWYRKKFCPNYFSLLQSKTLNYKREEIYQGGFLNYQN